MRRLEALRQDGAAQADLLIRARFGLDQAEIDALDDDAYFDLVARARWLEERDAEVVKVGVLLALAELFGRRR